MPGKRLTVQEYEIIYSMSFLANQSSSQIADAMGRATSTISTIVRWMKAVQEKDYDSANEMMVKGVVDGDTAKEWAKKRLGVTIPDNVEVKEEPTPDGNDGKFLMKLITEQAKQTAYLKCLKESQESYQKAMLSMMQSVLSYTKSTSERVGKVQELLVHLDDTVFNTGKAIAADLKDNVNANAEVLRQELNVIKNNTRKKGL